MLLCDSEGETSGWAAVLVLLAPSNVMLLCAGSHSSVLLPLAGPTCSQFKYGCLEGGVDYLISTAEGHIKLDHLGLRSGLCLRIDRQSMRHDMISSISANFASKSRAAGL